MQVIYKYPVPLQDKFELQMPTGARIIHVAEQPNQGDIYLWAIVDLDSPEERRAFVLRGTGHSFNGDEGDYVGTFICVGGLFVWHLFERTFA